MAITATIGIVAIRRPNESASSHGSTRPTVSLVSITIHLLNTARGWVRGIWLGVPATFAMQIALVRYVDLGSIRGAILIQASAYIAPLLINLAIGLRGMREPTRPPAAAAVSQHGHAG